MIPWKDRVPPFMSYTPGVLSHCIGCIEIAWNCFSAGDIHHEPKNQCIVYSSQAYVSVSTNHMPYRDCPYPYPLSPHHSTVQPMDKDDHAMAQEVSFLSTHNLPLGAPDRTTTHTTRQAVPHTKTEKSPLGKALPCTPNYDLSTCVCHW